MSDLVIVSKSDVINAIRRAQKGGVFMTELFEWLDKATPVSGEAVATLIADPALLPALKSPIISWHINVMDLPVNTKLYATPQVPEGYALVPTAKLSVLSYIIQQLELCGSFSDEEGEITNDLKAINEAMKRTK